MTITARKARPTPIRGFLKRLLQQRRLARVCVGGSQLQVDLSGLSLEKIAAHMERRGWFSPDILVEHVLKGANIAAEAEALGSGAVELAAFYQAVLDAVDPATIETIRADLERPRGLGELDIHDPDYERWARMLKLDRIKQISPELLDIWKKKFNYPFFVPNGPLRAVDYRPFLGDARDQGGRGTCTAFASTAVAEALEFFRDQRVLPRDFSEQLVFWYSKWGQLYTGGGYGCGAALRHHSEYGTCEEYYFPYRKQQLATNHAQVPMPDEAMDRAQFFRTGEVLSVPARDVDALKEVLLSGRCAAVVHDATDWNTATGTYTFPDPLDSKGIGGGHCTAIIGFIDRDDLPAHFEGGYFIERNSWGGAGSTTHLMGPEYGGHLLMPYGWYSRYTHSTYCLADKDGQNEEDRRWLVEYFGNEELEGAPIARVRVTVDVGFIDVTVSRAVPREVDELDFDWGSGGALRYTLPLGLGAVDLLPKDHFSARFTKLQRFRNGWYRFTLRGDDGLRLWIDDTLVINAWKPQAETAYTVEHYLSGGDHVLRVEYYERAGRAMVGLDVQAIPFTYDLFDNLTLAGPPTATFSDTLTTLEWRHAPPVNAITNGQFSLSGTATLDFEAKAYRFHARHSGGCRIYLDGALVLDDWSGGAGSGTPQVLAAGPHEVRVEFKHELSVPVPGDVGYYRAALDFGWSEETWDARFYQDARRQELWGNDDPEPGFEYRYWRTLALTGDVIFERQFDAVHAVTGHYLSADAPLRLRVSVPAELTADLMGAPDLGVDFLGAWIRRRIFVPDSGWYRALFAGGGSSRVVIDGKELLEDHVDGSSRVAADVYLRAGVHDVAIEWAVTKWSKNLDLRLERVAWQVQYYDGTNFETLVETKSLDAINRILPERPVLLGDTTFSVRAVRSISLPLGRYRMHVRTDDGARLKVNGIVKIDAWTDQSATPYFVEIDHQGGDIELELEYYQRTGSRTLELDLKPIGYFGEYYRGVTLEGPPPDSPLDRNVPAAYRFEDAIDFDWGRGSRLDRVGADEFSARWRGNVDLPVGRWRAALRADDGVRLYVDGRMLIDEWRNQAVTTHERLIDLVGREHEILVEYFEASGNAVCQLKLARVY